MNTNYKQSAKILKIVKSSRKILLNVHPNADLDSVGSATAMALVLKSMGKQVIIVSPNEIDKKFQFMPGADTIKHIDFAKFDFSVFDLFIAQDVSSFDRVTGSKRVPLPVKPLRIVIDHHLKNAITGEELLIEETSSATCEILYRLFSDWGVVLNRKIATSLFAGIAGDTVFFRYMLFPVKTMTVVTELLRLGADREKVLREVYQNNSLEFLTLLGKFLQKMALEKNITGKKFVWSAISYNEYAAHKKPKGVKDMVADFYFQSVSEAEFGVAVLEAKENEVSASLRSRGDVDVSVIARGLGGGGHKNAAGVTIFEPFAEGLKKILKASTDIKI